MGRESKRRIISTVGTHDCVSNWSPTLGGNQAEGARPLVLLLFSETGR